jgi:hypothetical protein
MGDSESTPEQHRIFSRLIDFLNRKNSKVDWLRSCWNDGTYYHGDELTGRLDTDYPVSCYTAGLDCGEISLDYNLRWPEQASWLSINFSEWARYGLKPKPRDLVLFSHNHYSEEKAKFGHLPIFQVRYDTLFVLPFDEARTAMLDFIKNGEKFAEYFTGMQKESKDKYSELIQRFKQFQDVPEVVRIG